MSPENKRTPIHDVCFFTKGLNGQEWKLGLEIAIQLIGKPEFSERTSMNAIG
jgi:hypothetical protein